MAFDTAVPGPGEAGNDRVLVAAQTADEGVGRRWTIAGGHPGFEFCSLQLAIATNLAGEGEAVARTCSPNRAMRSPAPIPADVADLIDAAGRGKRWSREPVTTRNRAGIISPRWRTAATDRVRVRSMVTTAPGW